MTHPYSFGYIRNMAKLMRNQPVARIDKIVLFTAIAEGLDNPRVMSRAAWAEIAQSDRLESWIEQLRSSETATRKFRLRLQALHDGNERKCGYCGQKFYARAGAKYCSPSHRAMGNR